MSKLNIRIHDFLSAISLGCACSVSSFSRTGKTTLQKTQTDQMGKWRCHFPKIRITAIGTDLGGVKGEGLGTCEFSDAYNVSNQQCQINSWGESSKAIVGLEIAIF